MPVTLYEKAESAYGQYKESPTIVPELLFAWLLAEVVFASRESLSVGVTLGGLPHTEQEIELWVEIANSHRSFRQSVKRARTRHPRVLSKKTIPSHQ